MKRSIDWLILLVCVVAACSVMRAQSVETKTGKSVWQSEPVQNSFTGGSICGLNTATDKLYLLQVACIDYDALRSIGAPIPPGAGGKVTQVLVHLRNRDAPAVRVVLDGVSQVAEVFTDSYGRRAALVQFPGTDYKTLQIQVLVIEP